VITGDASGLSGFKRKKLISEGVAIALRKDNPLASAPDFSLAELSGASFITMTEKSSLLGLTKKICNDFGFEPRITIQSDDPFYVRKCVELGLGVAIVPSFSWKGQFSDDVALRVIDGYSRDTYMCLNENKYLSRSAKEFCAMLVTETT
jgi:LysR family hydrogen peroxide-inducible transcriptional activator